MSGPISVVAKDNGGTSHVETRTICATGAEPRTACACACAAEALAAHRARVDSVSSSRGALDCARARARGGRGARRARTAAGRRSRRWRRCRRSPSSIRRPRGGERSGYRWADDVGADDPKDDPPPTKRPQDWTAEEKWALVTEAAAVPQAELGVGQGPPYLGTGTAWAMQLMPDSVRFVPAALAGSSPPLARMRSMLSSVRTVSLRTTSLRDIFFIASR